MGTNTYPGKALVCPGLQPLTYAVYCTTVIIMLILKIDNRENVSTCTYIHVRVIGAYTLGVRQLCMITEREGLQIFVGNRHT